MNLRTLGLRKSSPLRADHPGIGQRCVLCKRAIRAGDRTGLVPPLDSEEPALADGLICHWTCIESGLSRLEPDTDLYLHQRSRHGIEGCAKNRIARCVLD